jgi:hypothetical protein
MTIWCMRIACWITKVTNTRSEYIILIAFLQEQWLRNRAQCYRTYTLSAMFLLALILF